MSGERRLAELLDHALKGLGAGIRQGVREERLREEFADIVGPHLASMCEAVSLERGTLLVATAHSALAHQLQLDSPALIEALNHRLGATAVRRLRFRGR